MPSGSEKAMPVMPMTIDSMKPPNCLEATGASVSGSTSPSARATGPARKNHQISVPATAAIEETRFELKRRASRMQSQPTAKPA